MIEENVTIAFVILAVIAVASILLGAYLFRRMRRLERGYDILSRGARGKSFVEIVNDNIEETSLLRDEVAHLADVYGAVLRRMAGAVQHVGVVRYDAFKEIGGRMSFSVALLDDRGNGLVLTSIYGRSESRTYAKPIIERASTYDLSPEEREAIKLAMQSRELGAVPMVARDREHEEKIQALRIFHQRKLAGEENARAGVRENERQASIFDVERLDFDEGDVRGSRRREIEQSREAQAPTSRRRRSYPERGEIEKTPRESGRLSERSVSERMSRRRSKRRDEEES